jgi:hypothetical protein
VARPFAGETTSEVPATIRRSQRGRSASESSKNAAGRLPPNRTVAGLTAGAPQAAQRMLVDSAGAAGSVP